MVLPWASNDGTEFGGMRNGNGDEAKDAGDAGNGDGGTGRHRGGGLISCTCGGATQGDGMGSDGHCFTLHFALNTALPLRHLSSLFTHAPP